MKLRKMKYFLYGVLTLHEETRIFISISETSENVYPLFLIHDWFPLEIDH